MWKVIRAADSRRGRLGSGSYLGRKYKSVRLLESTFEGRSLIGAEQLDADQENLTEYIYIFFFVSFKRTEFQRIFYKELKRERERDWIKSR